VRDSDVQYHRAVRRGACAIGRCTVLTQRSPYLHPCTPLIRAQAQHVTTRTLYAVKVFSLLDRDKRQQLLHELQMLHSMDCLK
jgi:hypothetical protein